jgi:hypothetical protein
VDGALRATLRGGLRPFAAGGAAVLLFLWVTGARRRAAARHREDVVAHALGRVVLGVEGDGDARGDLAVLRPGATGLVIDVHTDPALATVVDAPPLVVALSHAGAGRTVRLSPRRDAVGGAARFRSSATRSPRSSRTRRVAVLVRPTRRSPPPSCRWNRPAWPGARRWRRLTGPSRSVAPAAPVPSGPDRG